MFAIRARRKTISEKDMLDAVRTQFSPIDLCTSRFAMPTLHCMWGEVASRGGVLEHTPIRTTPGEQSHQGLRKILGHAHVHGV